MKMRNRFRWFFKVGLSSLTLILLISLAGESLSFAAPIQDDPVFDAVPMDESMTLIDDDLLTVASDGESKDSKLDSSLGQLALTSLRSVEEINTLAGSLDLRMSGDLVQVNIATSAGDLDAAVQAVLDAGGEVTSVGNDETEIQSWLPVDALESITDNESVYYVRQPMYAELMGDLQAGSSSTEAMSAMNVAAWHTAGIKGAGVKVAIIDGGFEDYPSLLGTDLPAVVTAKNFVDFETDADVDGTTPHGTACAEVVHDIAPEATLYLIKVSTNLDLQQAVTYAIAQGVDIISTSLGWYNLTPGDGTGQFEDMVQDARDAGILWLTAASNDREMHWDGPFYSPGGTNTHYFTDTGNNVDYFGYAPSYAYLIGAGNQIRVFLRWDDWTDVDQDYNLWLVCNVYSGGAFQGWTIVTSSTNSQNGGSGQRPTEYISYITTSASAAYGFMITKQNGDRTVNLEVFTPKVMALRYVDYPSSLANLADALSAVTVAALDVDNPYPQESYSSEGPTNGPGGTLTGGSTKPDLSGFANVSTESYGPETFNGTSSATPHVAGAAALVLCANPTFAPDDIQEYLEDRAVDMGTAGMDTIYGYGRVRLGNPSGNDDDYNQYLPFIR